MVNTYSVSYLKKNPGKSLMVSERNKKCKYLDSCLQKRRHFSTFVVSVGSLLIKEYEAMLKRLAIRLAKNWMQPYSQTCRYVRSRVAITMVKATHRCIRESWLL